MSASTGAARPPLSVADVRGGILAAGLEIVADGRFSIIARGQSGGVLVHALEYPKGWRLQNALESRAATTVEIVRHPRDVERFCAALLRAGVR